MRNLFRKSFLAATVALALLASALPIPPVTPVRAQEAGCVKWQLVWAIIPDESGETAEALVSSKFYTGENPVRASSTPAMPTLPEDSMAEWQCTERDAALGSSETSEELGQGMELCAKAAELAARFGSFTALNQNFAAKIQTSVLNKITSYLQSEVFKTTKFDINNIASSSFDLAGEWLKSKIKDGETLFDDLIGNPIKEDVAGKVKKLEEETKKLLAEVTQDWIKKKAANVVTEKAASVLGLGGEVPVKAEGVESQLKVLEKKQDEAILQQKKAQLIAATRVKCAELLKNTNETIKRALLYQLSTQIVDWIQSGFSKDKTPQFIQKPGKFLEDTGRLALDRFISRVAPRLCSPFRLSVQLQIPDVSPRSNPFYENITCSLDRVVANVKGFYEDFRRGGWIGYYESLKPQNNALGASIMAEERALMEQAKARDEAARDLAGGHGFRSQRECVEWWKYVPVPPNAPASSVFGPVTVEGFGDFMMAGDQTPESSEIGAVGPVDPDGNEVSGFVQEPTGPLVEGVRLWKQDLSYFWECMNDAITSPSIVAAELAVRASQVDLDDLAASQDVSMFLQTIEDSIINKLTKVGVKGLQGLLKGLPEIKL